MLPRGRSHVMHMKRMEQIEQMELLIKQQMSETQLMAKAAANGAVNELRNPIEKIRLNVGGRSALLAIDVIRLRLDSSRLAAFCDKSHIERLTECDSYFLSTDEYYFEKSPTIFEYVVDWYTTGKLHLPTNECAIRIRDELSFWRIPLTNVSPCCRFDDVTFEECLPRFSSNDPIDESSSSELFDKVYLGKSRFAAWKFLENPRSSIGAKIFSVVSAGFVLASLTGLILGSCPEFQVDQENMTAHWTIAALEYVCMIFFTLEYVARFAVSPQKWSFAKSGLNVIDLMTILPFFAEECIMPLFGIQNVDLRNLRAPMIVMRVLRVCRVIRIFKLARYSTGLRAFGDTMRKSAAEFSMLGMFLLSGIMLFSTAIYFFERDEPNTKFYSIPASSWFCLITMTTVGYGDLYPTTAGGKIVASTASVCGIIVLAFPISMILDKFAESTSGFKKDEYVTLQRPAVLQSEQILVNNRFKSMRKSKRYVY